MNLRDEYQNFLIFIALIIDGDGGWVMNPEYFPPNLSPVTNVGNGAHRRDGNQASIKVQQSFNIRQKLWEWFCDIESLN